MWQRARRWVLSGVLMMASSGLAFAASPPSADDHRHDVFTALLADHVHDGHVAYPALCKDARLPTYLASLDAAEPSALDPRAELALWINAYNAYTLKLICDNYPVASINDLAFGGLAIGTLLGKTAWDRDVVHVGGQVMTLNHVEHEIVRKRFADPRVHFALVCAARSCPALRSEAYEGARLSDQLDDQGRQFFADPFKNRFDTTTRTAELSKILDWFGSDFGDGAPQVLLAISAWAPPEAATSIRADAKSWTVRYISYDWSLNE